MPLRRKLIPLTNSRIITQEQYISLQNDNNSDYNFQTFDYNSLREKYLVKDNADYDVPDDRRLIIENVFIKTLSGETITLRNVNANTSVRQLKNEIYKTERIPPEEINLRGSITIFVLDRDFLDPPFDYDFTNIQSSKKYMRGNFNYNRPYGWRRIALKILDKFNDNSWLGVNNRVTCFDSVKDEWIVSYHGTAKHNANSIAKDGFDLSKGKRFHFGHGIYSTPYIEIAASYAQNFDLEGEKYKIVFQNRVKPNAFKTVSDGSIFVTDNDRDIRPYGICIQKA
ncbi:15967_t:CDS:2 [Funneliformis caledonium]|uniref:15967_t:CDS:1 n=1 Tax=Funneliformis caledonium TaxID=1117310 RepID=A0A9N8W2G0_9GLOM|nr:15967_t:CDS:2 [Funneliformis caledonium]